MPGSTDAAFMSGDTTSGEVTPRTASARVGHRDGPHTPVSEPHVPAHDLPQRQRAVLSRGAVDRSPVPKPVPRQATGIGRPPLQKGSAQLSIEHERLVPPSEEVESELLVVDFTPSKGSTVDARAPATNRRLSPSTHAKEEVGRGLSFPSWTERRPSRGHARAASSVGDRVSSVHSRGLSPSSQRPTLVVDEERERDEQQRKFRIVRNLFASHEDGVRFCLVLEQLLAMRALASQEFEAHLQLLPKHEAAKLRALREKEDARRRAREDKIWDVENVVRRAVPTEPPALLAKLFNKGTDTDADPQARVAAAAEKRKAAEAERKALQEKEAMAHRVATLEKALQDAKADNAQLKQDLAAAQAKNRDADLVQSTRPTVDPRHSFPSSTYPRGGSSASGGNDADLWAAIEELRRAVTSLNRRVGTIEQREQMSMLDAIAQLRRDLQQLDQRAALMEGRQRAALGW